MIEQNDTLFDLRIEPETSEILRDAAKWARILGIIGFVFTGLMAVMGIFVIIAMAAVSRYSGGSWGALAGLFYIIMAAVYFMPTLWLFQFGRRTKAALDNNDQLTLNTAFGNLKGTFKFIGILSLVGVGISVLIIIISIFSAAFVASRY